MKRTILLILVISIGYLTMAAQNTEEQWDTYVASYEDGNPGSTTLRMDLINQVPIENLPYVLVTGISYETSREDGFPENETFQILHKVSDELGELISNNSEALLVGSFMFNKERLEYFYIDKSEGIKKEIEDFYANNYPNFKYYLNIKEDKGWEYYTDFLYPNEETQNYMADQSVLRNLLEAGDPLTKERRVDHWLYFPQETNMKNCKIELSKMNFKIHSSGINKETSLPYELQIWRTDKVDIDSIYPITSKLRQLAKTCNGEYDGWETSVEKE